MIPLLLQYVPGEVWAALGGLVAVLGVWLTGRRQGAVAAKNKAAARNAEAYRKTAERINNAGNDDLDDAAVRERLRKLGGK